MAVQQPGFSIGFLVANASLASDQFKFVKVNSSAKIALCGTLGESALGVLQDTPSAADQECAVMTDGVTKVVAGAALAAGARVTTSAAGKAVAAATGHHALGVLLEASGADGDIVTMKLQRDGIQA